MIWGGMKQVALRSILAPGNVKERQKQAHVVELAKDIAELGDEPINALAAKKTPKGWLLLAGRDRYSALLLNKAKRAWVHVVEDATAQELHDLEVSENLHRRVDDRNKLVAERVRKLTERVVAERASSVTNVPKLGRPKSPEGEARDRAAAELGTTPAAIKQAAHRAKERDEGAAGGVLPGKSMGPPPPPIDTLGVELNQSQRDYLAAQHAMCAAVDNAARAAQAAVSKFSESGWAFDTRRQVEELRDQAHRLGVLARSMKLVSVCPYCRQKNAACTGCGGVGYATAEQLTSAPKELLQAKTPGEAMKRARGSNGPGSANLLAQNGHRDVKPAKAKRELHVNGKPLSEVQAEIAAADGPAPDVEQGDVDEEGIHF